MFFKGDEFMISKKMSGLRRFFLNKKFFNYTWIGIVVSVINIFLLWLLIDVVEMSTILASILVVIGTFILRYILFDLFRVL